MSESNTPASCRNETCQFCGRQATRKISEEILEPDIETFDDPETGTHYTYQLPRHPYTCYVCEEHFWMVMRQPSAQTVNAVLEAATNWSNALKAGHGVSYFINIIWFAVNKFRKEQAKQHA